MLGTDCLVILPLGQSWLQNYELKTKVPGALCVSESRVCESTLTKTVYGLRYLRSHS